MFVHATEPKVKRAAAAMARMRGLKAGDVFAKHVFMQPVRNLAAKSSLSLGRMKEACAMQGVTCKGRRALPRDDKHKPRALAPLVFHEVIELHARHFDAVTMKIKTGIRLQLPPRQALGRAAVKSRKWWRCRGQ